MLRFIIFAMLSGLCITWDYSIVRPASTSIFIDCYGAAALPYAWIAMIPITLLIVSLYNYFVVRWGCLKVFLTSTLTVILINTLAALFLKSGYAGPFIYFAFKEIYVLLMFQQLWSVIHSKVDFKKAKYLYGLFFAVGGLGSVIGSGMTGYLATSLGSQHLLLMTLPIYTLFMICYTCMLKEVDKVHITPSSEFGGLTLLRRSGPLQLILMLVVLMQVGSTFLEYQFNTSIALEYPIQDVRTAFTGRIFGVISLVTLVLQLAGGSLLVKFVGLKGGHLFIPTMLLTNTSLCLMIPSFNLFAYSYSTIKSFDHSIFRVLTEMLYIPLKKEEKFQAKAIIDVFAYRTARAVASFGLIFLQLFCLESLISWMVFGVMALWMGVVLYYFSSYYAIYEQS
jgi:AAA family ATP:ADP antiporter